MSLVNKFLAVFLSLLSLLHFRALALDMITSTLTLSHAAAPVAGNGTDFLALLAFKSKISAEYQGALSSWNESLHFCNWQGVKCSRRHHGRVTSIDLMSRGLMGSLSPHIGNLSFLRVLRLSNNAFLGAIPAELGNLFRLQTLNLTINKFDGEIPASLSRCYNLVFLDVGYNKLVGGFSQLSAYSMPMLMTLNIYENNLTGGIPPSIGNLTSLEAISAAGNPLGGRIQDSLGQLKNLNFLALGGTQLSGIIPPSVYNLSLLIVLSVPSNQLGGSLPPSFGSKFPHLQILQLSSNYFTGPLPISISNSSQLVWLELERNNFSGKITTDFGNLQYFSWMALFHNNFGSGESDDLAFLRSLTNCSNLEVLGFGVNQFGGVLPDSVGNMSSNLFSFTIGVNQIHGTIPSTIGNLVNLESLAMHSNQFTSTIPSSIGYLVKLQRLGFSDNELSGKIPDSIGNLSLLNDLYLEGNRLEGTIPSSLGNCQNLLLLNLSGNNLSGTIPRQLFAISSLSIFLGLARNHFSGSLPVEVGKLQHLVEIDISENGLSGEIPSTLGSCNSLENLYLQRNFFEGSIPSSLESLRGIQNIDLSHNNLSGQIPTFLGTFSLKKLDLSFNDFEGELPIEGILTNASVISVAGNYRLCGGISELQLPSCTTKRSERKMSLLQALAVTASVIVGVSLLSFSIICLFKKKRKQKSTIPVIKESFLNVTYGELLKATNGFSSKNLLGFGNFGRVYRGILDQDTVVAVKVLNLQTRGATKSFMAECEALRNIRHRNLVRTMTSCSSVDFQGNEFKALVYEFMPNGNLESWLHLSPNAKNGQNEFQGLNLLQRINIAIDVACALDYLHHQCQMPIIHCDLKPSNILLDYDMVAHVGDFGLARFCTDLTTSNSGSSIAIRGTIGYVAPEYGLGSKMSTNGDVYSYGIMLLEMITAQRPTDNMFGAGHNLHNFARMALPHRLKEIVDPVLLIDRNNSSKMVEYLISMIHIGLACSADSPQDRMSISNVLSELYAVKNKILMHFDETK